MYVGLRVISVIILIKDFKTRLLKLRLGNGLNHWLKLDGCVEIIDGSNFFSKI